MVILLPIAFISGILTAFTPCALPVLPIILGSGAEGKRARILGIILGIVISFTLFTLLIATVLRSFGISADSLRFIAVLILLLFGLALIWPQIWDRVSFTIERFWRFKPVRTSNNSFFGGFLTGGSLGIVWAPCVGPIIATVATLSVVGEQSIFSSVLVLFYAMGAGLGLYFIAKAGTRLSKTFGFLKQNSQKLQRMFGYIIVVTAVFIFFGFDLTLRTLTLSFLPEVWTQLPTKFEESFDIKRRLDNLKNKDKGEQAKPGSTVVRDLKLQNDFSGSKVARSDLIQGCFGGKDCIPSIDSPKFESAQQTSWLRDDDMVFAIDYKGIQRAYPQRILNWHEIVNDEITGVPIAITFCPLCGSALAFERKVDGIITEFGVSGKLHNSDLVMYDRYEGNLWQQITGEGIVGPAARRNEKLKQIPIITAPWGKWKQEYPKTQVLSRNTGHSRNYDQYPYGTYEQDDQLLFGVKGLDKSLQIKTAVYGIEIDGKSKAYPESIFDEKKVIEDTVGDIVIRLERKESGEIHVLNLQTNEEVIPIRLFWFAWAAFHPDTELYK